MGKIIKYHFKRYVMTLDKNIQLKRLLHKATMTQAFKSTQHKYIFHIYNTREKQAKARDKIKINLNNLVMKA